MLSRAGTARAGCVMPAIVTPVFALSASLAFSESFDVTLINGTGTDETGAVVPSGFRSGREHAKPDSLAN